MAGGGASKGLGKSCFLVIVVAGVERFAFKGVASNLVTYLTEVVKFSNSSAAKIVNTWCGVTFMLPLLGAFLADSLLDRYSTILASSVLYVVTLLCKSGVLSFTEALPQLVSHRHTCWKEEAYSDLSLFQSLAALTLTAFISERSSTSKSNTSSLLLSLFLMSLGQGGYNPCLQAFGIEQLEDEGEDELPICTKEDSKSTSDKKSSFFQWWYFGICSGSLLGVSLMSYLQDALGWGLGFAIPTISMAISVTPFACGTPCYKHKEHNGEDKIKRIEKFKRSIKTCVSKMTKMVKGRITLPPKQSEVTEFELEETPLSSNQDYLDEKPNHEVDLFDDIKAVLRLLPIWTMLLMFAIIFQQPATFFTKQGMTMKRNIGKNLLIPPATLQSAINISVILLMPLYGKLIIPIFRVITGDEKGINVMQRMGVGMFFSVIAMAIAALVETKRLEMSTTSGTVSLSIFWLLPQYILLGISDVFTVVGMQEFFYTEVPNRMKTIGMALHLSVFGVGSFLSALLISVIEIVTSDGDGRHSWFSDDMREARLNRFYWLLALSSALSLMFFVHLCKNHVSRTSYERVNCK